MRLRADECWERLRAAERAVLCTTNARGAVDAVPVCFAAVGRRVATPIDLVKPKGTTELGRLRNLERDAAATLLCDHWDRDDWSRLWWVRARLVRCCRDDVSGRLRRDGEAALRTKYAQYRDAAFADLIVFDVKEVAGWSATDPPATPEPAPSGPQWVGTDPLM